MFPAVLVLLNVPISIDSAMITQFSPLKFAFIILLKSIGFINVLQFRRASNSKAKWVKETQQNLILRSMSQNSNFT